MKFKITISNEGTLDADGVKKYPPRIIMDFDGELDAVKTYLKLSVDVDKFKWGAVERTDEVEAGDVNRWIIHKNHTTGQLEMNVFSFHDVDASININAYMESYKPGRDMQAVNEMLGGGKF